MHNKHRLAVAPRGVLDRPPSCRDDVAFHCGEARTCSFHILSITV